MIQDANKFDVIIIGGSYAGLSAAMALGRSLRKVLVIDNNLPCNRQTPFSHNFLTQDGQTPASIRLLAKEQVAKYETVQFLNDTATEINSEENSFLIKTEQGSSYIASKLIFATGIKDLLPPWESFDICWGISILHCPYCHGYEVSNRKTGLLANGDFGFEFAGLLRNWTADLTVFTNGRHSFSKEQETILAANQIQVIDHEIKGITASQGQIREILFANDSQFDLDVLYTRPPFEQSCSLPAQLGCEINPDGYLVTDALQKTNIKGVYACGDNSSRIRTVSHAVAMGTVAGLSVNRELTDESFLTALPV